MDPNQQAPKDPRTIHPVIAWPATSERMVRKCKCLLDWGLSPQRSDIGFLRVNASQCEYLLSGDGCVWIQAGDRSIFAEVSDPEPDRDLIRLHLQVQDPPDDV